MTESDEVTEAREYFREYVEQVSWKFAKSMPQNPHWYTVRWDRPDLDKMFCKFAQFIRDYGYQEFFYRKAFMFFDIGEFKYWTYGDPIKLPREVPKSKNTFILNRAKKENVYGGQNDNDSWRTQS